MLTSLIMNKKHLISHRAIKISKKQLIAGAIDISKMIKNNICYSLNSILKSINNGDMQRLPLDLLYFDEIVV